MIDTIRMTWQMYRIGICSFHGRFVRLTHMEAEILSVFLMRRGRLTTTTDLIEAIYPDPDLEPDTAANCIAVVLGRVRRKLPGLIETIGYQGHLIELPHEELRQAA